MMVNIVDKAVIANHALLLRGVAISLDSAEVAIQFRGKIQRLRIA